MPVIGIELPWTDVELLPLDATPELENALASVTLEPGAGMIPPKVELDCGPEEADPDGSGVNGDKVDDAGPAGESDAEPEIEPEPDCETGPRLAPALGLMGPELTPAGEFGSRTNEGAGPDEAMGPGADDSEAMSLNEMVLLYVYDKVPMTDGSSCPTPADGVNAGTPDARDAGPVTRGDATGPGPPGESDGAMDARAGPTGEALRGVGADPALILSRALVTPARTEEA